MHAIRWFALTTAVAAAACSSSGPIELEAKSYSGPFHTIQVDGEGNIKLEDTRDKGKPAALPPQLQLVTFELPAGTTVSLLGHESPRSEGSGIFGKPTHEHGETFDGTQLLHGMHTESGGWSFPAGAPAPKVACSYEMTVSVEGRGASTIEDSAYCGSYFQAVVTRYLDAGKWLELDGSEDAAGHLAIRTMWEERPEAIKLKKRKSPLFSVEGRGESIRDIRYLVVAREVEAEKKKCSGYRDAAGAPSTVYLRRTQVEISVRDLVQGKIVAETKIPSVEARCPDSAFRGDFFIERPDLDAEQAWIERTLRGF